MNRDNTTIKSRGFTIVELMLAMSFVAVLLVAIALVTVQISKIYNKGLTLKEVNQVGRSVTEDFQRTIGATVPFALSATPPQADNYVETAGRSGRLCTGKYSYVWNYGKALAGDAPIDYKYADSGEPVVFAKVNDPSGAICADPSQEIDKAEAVELLGNDDDRLLVLQTFSISASTAAIDKKTGQTLYSISMKLGTNDRDELSDEYTCQPPADSQGGEDFCSINQFDFVVRAGNKSGEE